MRNKKITALTIVSYLSDIMDKLFFSWVAISVILGSILLDSIDNETVLLSMLYENGISDLMVNLYIVFEVILLVLLLIDFGRSYFKIIYFLSYISEAVILFILIKLSVNFTGNVALVWTIFGWVVCFLKRYLNNRLITISY